MSDFESISETRREGDKKFTEPPSFNYSDTSPQINAEEFIKVVKSRRSVRIFDSTPIPEEVVQRCLDMALLAPNSSNLQPWDFYWVRSYQKKRELIEACFSQSAAKTAAELFVAVARTETWKDHAKRMLEYYEQRPDPVPDSVITYYKRIVPLAYEMGPLGIFSPLKKMAFFTAGLFRVVPREPSSSTDLKIWAIKSTALACENFMLSFRAFGFDTCPMEGLDSTRVKKILNLPADAHIVMAISAGKRDKKGVYGPRMRFPREEFIKEI